MSDTMTSGFAARVNRTQRTIAVDNLLRKTLRVSDPRDPGQIATALLARYPDDADRDRRERAGLPYTTLRDPGIVLNGGIGTAGMELETARSDLERDLQALTTQSQLKDISVELIGWGRAIRAAAADGIAAARLAIDVVQHDSALSARRNLSEYARLARYVGALSDGSGLQFRRLAQSCDVLGALILVAIGEGLAAAGITRSTKLVRVAAGELQARRNGVVQALRSLTGSFETALGQNDYPRGTVGFLHLIQSLEAGGQSDLRALLEENTLSAAMDQLVDLSTSASVAGLRELSTTSAFLVHRFNRLITFGRSVVLPLTDSGNSTPESPPLLQFVAALQLFVDAFATSGSTRLLYLARPPILAYGLYNASDIAPAKSLFQLTMERSNLVEAVDCFAGCSCDPDSVRCTVLFDFALGMVDRAIDLLAVGTDPDGRGEPEARAIAAGLIAAEAIHVAEHGFDATSDGFCEVGDDVRKPIEQVVTLLVEPFQNGDATLDEEHAELVVHELVVAFQAEKQTERLVRNLVTGCNNRAVFAPAEGKPKGDSLIRLLIRRVLLRFSNVDPDGADDIDLPPTTEAILAGVFENRGKMGHVATRHS